MNENISSLYEQLGREVFDSLRERDESVPAEQFFDELMFSAMSLCVAITDCIKEEEENAQPAVAEIPVTRMMAFTDDDDEDEDENENEPLAPILFCTNCGARLDDDSVFCTKCGHKVEF